MTSVSDAFSPLRAALDAAGVRYAVGGSWASTAFGEPRLTNDVDILAGFTSESLDRFWLRFRKPTTPIRREPKMPSASAGLST